MSHLKVAYTNPYVLKWSVWVAFATCGYFQVGNYIQALWKYIQTEDNPENYNGAVEATATLIGIYRTCTIITYCLYTPPPPIPTAMHISTLIATLMYCKYAFCVLCLCLNAHCATIYCISANSFHGNYYFLNLTLGNVHY